MSNVASLQVLKDNHNHNALLLAEVAALLHDVGKFCNLHIEAHAKGGQKKWSNQHAYKVVIDDPQSVIYLSKVAASLKKPDALNNVLNAQSPKAADFISAALKDFLQNNTINLFGESYSLAELIMLGTPGFATDKNRPQLLDGKSGWLAAVLGVCHNEAHVDKEDPPPGQGDQIWPDVFISTAFGYEGQKVVVDTSPESLDKRLRKLPVPPIRDQVLEEFSYGLGDTRRPVNEVVLSDWGWMVASLFKPAIAVALLTNQQPGIRQWKSWKDKIIDHDLRWRLLRVNFDVLGLYAKAVKIADLLGYQRVVDEACEAVKKLIEEEYPLGNEIYRDSSGIYFTFPDLDLPADLAQEIRRRVEEVEMELTPRIAVTVGNGNTATEQLKGILGKARKEALEALAQPFDRQNLSVHWQQRWMTVSEGKWELCSVCRLRPMREGVEACETCEQRRGSRIETWENNPAQTIWMDEIADHNDRVALIVGKFGLDNWLSGDLVQTMLVRADPNNPGGCIPKNPSPARLRRVWETCRRFWTETVEQEILGRHDYNKGDPLRCVRQLIIPDQKTGWRENVPYDGTVDGKPISLLWRAQAQHFVTISNLQLSGEIKPGQVIHLDDPDNPGRQFTVTVQGTMPASGAMGTYAPYLPLLVSPDQFLALVPAAEALEIAGKIRAEYARQFGKVQNRLPLFLGLVFFQRKTPLLAVMDTARRMLAGEFANSKWQIVDTPQNDRKTVTLSLEQAGQRITLQVPLVMGDGTTEDVWYPYFELVGQPAAHHTYRFQRDGAWWVHVKTLQAGETVRITPSRFAYLFLESTAQRFRFDPLKDVLLLDDLPRLMEMWKAICKSPEMSDTKLQAIHALFESKLREWKLGEPTSEHPITDETFRYLVETTLRRDNVQGMTVEDVLNGRFRRCVDLHLHILKRRVSDEKKQEEL
jgi:hypothetical protein